MNKKGSTTLQYVILFFVVSLIIAAIYQTWFFARVRTVVTNAAQEASRTYAQNAEAYNAVALAKQAATNLVSSNLATGKVTGTYDVDNIPADWIKGVLQKNGTSNYVVGIVDGLPMSTAIKNQLDQKIGKQVAVKAENITDESKKNSFVQVSNSTISNNNLYGSITNLSEKTSENLYGTITGSSSGSYYFKERFNFTGYVQVFVVPVSGKYLLEVWGARGGTSTIDVGADSLGGKGGYAKGEITLNKGDKLYIYVGGRGSDGRAGRPAPGGFNGGGNGGYNTAARGYSDGGAGGGATDIRYGGTSLNNRIIVAGGGGGGAITADGGTGGCGGGWYGGDGVGQRSGYGGGGGTETSGGWAYYWRDAYTPASTGGFGYGGSGSSGDAHGGGGGGGGWYGGGGGSASNPPYLYLSVWSGTGGGGSSYIGGVHNGITITCGNTSTENGYAVITYIDKKFAVNFNTSNTFPSVFEQNETKNVTVNLSNPSDGAPWSSNTKLQVSWYDANNNLVKIDEFSVGAVSPGTNKGLQISVTAPSNIAQYKVVYSLVSSNEKAEQIQTFNPVKVIQKKVYVNWGRTNTIPSPLESKNPENVYIMLENKSSTTWTPANTSIIVEWKNQSTYIKKTYPISYNLSPNQSTVFSIPMPPDDVPIGTYDVTYKIISDGIEGSEVQTFSNVKVENRIHFDLLEGGINNKVPAFVETGKVIQAKLQFQRTDNRNDIPLKEGNIVYQWRIGGQVRYEYPLKLGGKGTLYAGESFYENVPIQSPPVQGVYDLVILAKPITGNPIFTSTEIIFKDIYVGVEPKQTVITGVMDVNDKTVNVDTPLLTVNIKPNGDTVTSEVIYHAPLVWNFGKFMSGINKPIFDIKGESVMRIEKPLFEAERK